MRDRLTKEIDDERQEELGKLVSVLPDLPLDAEVIAEGEIAVEALVDDETKLEKMGSVLQRDLIDRVRGTSASAVVYGLAGSFAVLTYFGTLVWLTSRNRTDFFLGFPIQVLAVMVVTGALGSLVSVLSRLGDFASVKRERRRLLVLTGVGNTIIGVASAIFVYLLVESAILPIDIPPDSKRAVLAALGFIAGFSERFVPDLVKLTAARVIGDTRRGGRRRRSRVNRQR